MKKLFLLLFLAFCGISSYTAFAQDASLKHILADWDAETKAAKFKDGKNQFEIVHIVIHFSINLVHCDYFVYELGIIM